MEGHAEAVQDDEETGLSGPPTLSPDFVVQIAGWENDNAEEAQSFGRLVFSLVQSISSLLDLSRLEKVITATDYYAALADVKGGGSAEGPKATQNEYGTGAAMACSVVRGDDLWNVVVIWTGLVRQLADEDHPDHSLALHTLFHEMAHVDDYRKLSRTFPGGWRAAKGKDERTEALLKLASQFANEFIAQSASAFFAPEQGFTLIDMLDKAMADVDEQIITARRAYRIHGDMEVFWSIVADRLGFLFQALGYGLGHYDWIDRNRDDHPELAARYDKVIDNLRRHAQGKLVDRCREAVAPIVDQREWTGMNVYDNLTAVVEDTLNSYGLHTRLENGGLYVDAPYSSAVEY